MAHLVKVLHSIKRDLLEPTESTIKFRIKQKYGLKSINSSDWKQLIKLASKANFIISIKSSTLVIFPPSGAWEFIDLTHSQESDFSSEQWKGLLEFIKTTDQSELTTKGKHKMVEYLKANGPSFIQSMPLGLVIF